MFKTHLLQSPRTGRRPTDTASDKEGTSVLGTSVSSTLNPDNVLSLIIQLTGDAQTHHLVVTEDIKFLDISLKIDRADSMPSSLFYY